MSSYQPRIAIIGGGPAGLTLGLHLHKHSIPFAIFELRPKPTEDEFAQPTGMLDLHEESGLSAIKEAGLLDEFNALTSVCASSQIVANKDGDIIYTDAGDMEYRPEISRNTLTKLLLSNLPAECIKWEHKLSSATTSTPSGQTETELDFGSKGKHTFDLVIGADGAWSKIRKLLTDTKPQYAGMQYITLTIKQATQNHPELSQYVGLGSFSSLGLKHGVMTQRALQDSIRIYAFISTPDEHFGISSGLADLTPLQARDKLLHDETLFDKWGSKIKDLISIACGEETQDHPIAKIDLRPLYSLPINITWNHKSGITLIGDAAHLMCPWAGEGVNLGMWDSLLLAKAIVKASDTTSFPNALDPAIEQFEEEMWNRAQEKAEETHSNGIMMFGTDDGAEKMVQFFESARDMIANGVGAGAISNDL